MLYPDVYICSEKRVAGSLGCGFLDEGLEYDDVVIAVTVVEKDLFDAGLAQNLVQLKALNEVRWQPPRALIK
jgi:hypothetical protein